LFDLLKLCFIAFPLFLTGQFRSLFSFQRTISFNNAAYLITLSNSVSSFIFHQFQFLSIDDVKLFVPTACLSRPELEYTIGVNTNASLFLKNFY